MEKMKNIIKEKFIKKFGAENFEDSFKQYELIKPFKINENIFETGQNIDDKTLFILREATALKLKEVFEAMKIDFNDANIYEDETSGNIGTWGRIAKMWTCGSIHDDSEMGSGRFMKPVRIATFPNENNQRTPITKRVSIVSSCSHHTAAFSTLFGADSYAIISYVPDKYVLGISKLQRLADFVSRRFWLQEDLTKALYEAVSKAAGTESVYVGLYNVKHTCEWLRGSRSHEGGFTCEYYGGYFDDNEARKQIAKIK